MNAHTSEAEYEAYQPIGVPLTRADELWNRSRVWRVFEAARSLRPPQPRPFEGSVYFQDEWWIDKHGHAHRVEDMSKHYIRNVINFLERRAKVIHARMNLVVLRAVVKFFEDMRRPSGLVTLTGRPLAWEEVWGEHLEDHFIAEVESMLGNLDLDPIDWLRGTPLLIALRARLGSTNDS